MHLQMYIYCCYPLKVYRCFSWDCQCCKRDFFLKTFFWSDKGNKRLIISALSHCKSFKFNIYNQKWIILRGFKSCIVVTLSVDPWTGSGKPLNTLFGTNQNPATDECQIHSQESGGEEDEYHKPPGRWVDLLILSTDHCGHIWSTWWVYTRQNDFT